MLPSRLPAPAHTPESVGTHQNGQLLATLWKDRWTGTVQLTQGDETFWITLKDGGPVCPEDSVLLSRALRRGGVLTPRAGTLDGEGSRERLGRLLVWCMSHPRRPTFADSNQRRVLQIDPEVLSLPLRPDIRRFLSQADGETSLSELAEQLDIALVDISSELAALHRIRLISFVLPRASFRRLSQRRSAR